MIRKLIGVVVGLALTGMAASSSRAALYTDLPDNELLRAINCLIYFSDSGGYHGQSNATDHLERMVRTKGADDVISYLTGFLIKLRKEPDSIKISGLYAIECESLYDPEEERWLSKSWLKEQFSDRKQWGADAFRNVWESIPPTKRRP